MFWVLVFFTQEAAGRVSLASGYFRGLAKIGFPGKSEFSDMVDQAVIKIKVRAEMESEQNAKAEAEAKAAAKAAASRRSWGF